MKTYDEIIADLKTNGKIKSLSEKESNDFDKSIIDKMKGYRREYEKKQIESQQIVSRIILNA